MKIKNKYVFLVSFLALEARASYMGGPEVFQYFFLVLIVGAIAGFVVSMARDSDGKMVSFDFGKFLFVLSVSFVLAIVAAFVGCEVGRH